jgi:ATP-binding cassette subfamily B protein
MMPSEGQNLEPLAWPVRELGAAVEALARAARLDPASARPCPAVLDPLSESSPEAIAESLERMSSALGLSATAVTEEYPRVGALVSHAAPALYLIYPEGRPYLLAVRAVRGARVVVVARDGSAHTLSRAPLRAALVESLEAECALDIDALLDVAKLPAARRARARRVLLDQRLSHVRVGGVWLLGRSRNARVAPRAQVRVGLALLLLATLALLEYALLGFSWNSVANGALYGHVDYGWLWAWQLALLSAVPLRGVLAWLSARWSIVASARLRERLLAGMLLLDPIEVRKQGVGEWMSRVLEVSNVETLGLSGGLQALLASVDLIAAAWLLVHGAAPGWSLALLSLCVALTFGIALAYLGRRRRWVRARLRLTFDLVENLTGHRTRVAQQRPSEWHQKEDALLEDYIVASRALDTAGAHGGVLPRVWLVAALACLTWALGFEAPAQLPVAFALAGILLATRALAGFGSGLLQLGAALAAWERVRDLLRLRAPVEIGASVPRPAPSSNRAVLDAHGLAIHAPGSTTPLLSNVDLRLRKGDRVLLEGASGSGKSALARVLAGLRAPASGLLLCHGLDRSTLGAAGFARRVSLAPQFHESHVFSASFAFNLLLGRAWPPRPAELEHAARLCRELGLGPLLEQMPAGLMQIVGETGWQLSHGERSRLFIARALLSRADVVILDESMAALDPPTAASVLRCAKTHAPALLLIAHP